MRSGDGEAPGAPRQFAPPALESVVSPRRPADGGRLRAALNELAEQDPFINVRQDDERHEISVSLYGEVQKEVIGETLARDYGVEVDFHETTSICIERPVTVGEELEVISSPIQGEHLAARAHRSSTNPWPATVGLRIEPAPPGSGIEFRMDVWTSSSSRSGSTRTSRPSRRIWRGTSARRSPTDRMAGR